MFPIFSLIVQYMVNIVQNCREEKGAKSCKLKTEDGIKKERLYSHSQQISFLNKFSHNFAVQYEIETFRNKKLEYVDLFTENVLTIDDLVEFRELTDNKIKEIQIKKVQLVE